MALYRISDGARLTGQLAWNTTAGGIDTVASSQNIALTAGVLYAVAITVSSAASSTNGLYGITLAPGFNVAPLSYPNEMDLDANNFLSTGFGLCATTGGDLPSTLPTITAATNLVMPLFFLGNT